MRKTLLVAFSVLSVAASGQPLIPFRFTSDDDNRLIRENDSVKFYVASGDTSLIVGINEEAAHYKLLTHDKKLVAEGHFIADGDKYYQDGRWTEFFNNGKIHRVGSYKRGIPIGMWEEYHSNGLIKTVSNYGVFEDQGEMLSCLSGTYREYYQGGKLKVSGFYCAKIGSDNDTIMVNDPTTGQDVRKIIPHKILTPVKVGQWDYFDENGDLEKKEDH